MKASRIFSFRVAPVNIVTKSSARSAWPMPQTGIVGSSGAQTVKESAMAKSPRTARQRQAAIIAIAWRL
jgi:hypothetical protein